MSAQQVAVRRIRWWVPGDWNGFFGLFTNVVLNVIVLTGLCLGVVQAARRHCVRPHPAGARASRCRSAICTTPTSPSGSPRPRAASDVTAMPYGPSVPHMFIVVFVIMLPIYLKTKDAILAWQAGLAWAFIIGVIVLLGAFVGPTIRRLHAARRDARHARRHLDRVHLDAARLPDVGGAVDRVRLARHRADRAGPRNVRLPGGMPGGLAAVIVGTVIAWVAALLGWTRLHERRAGVGVASHSSACTCRCRAATCLPGLANIAPLLVTAIPLGIYNFTEGDEQRRERVGRGRQLQPAQHSAGRRHRRDRRLDARQPVPAGGLYRPSGLEVGRRPHRLFAGDRRRDRAGLLPRPHRAAACGGAAGRDPADPAVHRPGDRRAGVSGHAGEARAGGRARDHSEHRRLGARPRSTARSPPPAQVASQVGMDKLGRPASSITAWSCSAAARCSPA